MILFVTRPLLAAVYSFSLKRTGTHPRSPLSSSHSYPMSRYDKDWQYSNERVPGAFWFPSVAQVLLTFYLLIFAQTKILSFIMIPDRQMKMRPLLLIEHDRKILAFAFILITIRACRHAPTHPYTCPNTWGSPSTNLWDHCLSAPCFISLLVYSLSLTNLLLYITYNIRFSVFTIFYNF